MRVRILCSVLALGAACVRPSPPGAPGPAAAPARASGLVSVLADTATVRRLCAAPDSVIAGRKVCELREQRRYRDVRIF
jgi:hypothetical protein